MFAEHLGAAQQGDQLGRPPPVRPHQQARPVHLEPEITARALHPVDHPGIQQLISKLAVLGLHLEHPVEALGLEFDVVEAEVAGHPARHVLAFHRHVWEGATHLRERDREMVIGPAAVSLPVGRLLVVPVVGLAHGQVLPLAPQHVLASSPVTHPEQVEVGPGEVEGVRARELEAPLECEQGQGLAALLLGPPRQVADGGHDGQDQDEEDYGRHRVEYDQPFRSAKGADT